MIARVTWGKIKPGKWTEFEAMWNDYAKAAADAPGSHGRVLLRDAETQNAGYSISFWADQQAFESFKAKTPAPGGMQECFIGQYVTTVTEVSGTTIPRLK
jgi:heme-degrading monooxygenase HmoA